MAFDIFKIPKGLSRQSSSLLVHSKEPSLTQFLNFLLTHYHSTGRQSPPQGSFLLLYTRRLFFSLFLYDPSSLDCKSCRCSNFPKSLPLSTIFYLLRPDNVSRIRHETFSKIFQTCVSLNVNLSIVTDVTLLTQLFPILSRSSSHDRHTNYQVSYHPTKNLAYMFKDFTSLSLLTVRSSIHTLTFSLLSICFYRRITSRRKTENIEVDNFILVVLSSQLLFPPLSIVVSNHIRILYHSSTRYLVYTHRIWSQRDRTDELSVSRNLLRL